MDEEPRDPVRPEPSQDVVLGPGEDRVAQTDVPLRLLDLPLGVRRQLEPVLVLDIPGRLNINENKISDFRLSSVDIKYNSVTFLISSLHAKLVARYSATIVTIQCPYDCFSIMRLPQMLQGHKGHSTNYPTVPLRLTNGHLAIEGEA